VAKRSRRGTRETGEEMREAERSVTAPPNLALLPDLAQSRVHAAYDPVCGVPADCVRHPYTPRDLSTRPRHAMPALPSWHP